MHAPLEAYLQFLQTAGVEYSLSPGLKREADHRGPLLSEGPNPRRLYLPGGSMVSERFDPAGGRGADHASLSVAAALVALRPPVAGLGVVDLGCGTGVLGITAALLGARVTATDVDSKALELARANAATNGVSLDLRFGSLCAPLDDGPVDLFLANLPHKPSCGMVGLPPSQDGGPDGDSLFLEALPGMASRQRTGDRLLFSLHSLPHPRLLRNVQKFYALELVRWKLRWLDSASFGQLLVGFRRRHSAGSSLLVEEGGREGVIAGVWLCRRSRDRS